MPTNKSESSGSPTERYGTISTFHRRILTSAVTIAAFAGTVPNEHNWSSAGPDQPAALASEGRSLIPMGGTNQIVLDFFGKGTGSFKVRVWGVRWDHDANAYSRRIRAEITVTLGAIPCPQTISGSASTFWGATATVVSYGVVPIKHVLDEPGSGAPLQLLLDPGGDEFLLFEFAQDSGTATAFNGRYYFV